MRIEAKTMKIQTAKWTEKETDDWSSSDAALLSFGYRHKRRRGGGLVPDCRRYEENFPMRVWTSRGLNVAMEENGYIYIKKRKWV